MKRTLVFLAVFSLAQGVSFAAEQNQSQQQDQVRQQVYGSQMMTPEERAEYRTKMRSMKTREEREAFRREHHQKMQERAKERGMQLPDSPPSGQGGMGRGGMGAGGGMGGGGMGPGGGMRGR